MSEGRRLLRDGGAGAGAGWAEMLISLLLRGLLLSWVFEGFDIWFYRVLSPMGGYIARRSEIVIVNGRIPRL